MWLWVPFLCAVSFVAGILISSLLWKREETRQTRRPAGDELGDVDYARGGRAMTDAQLTLHRMLTYLYRDKYIILARTSLEAAVDLPKGMARRSFHIDRLRAKPVDFILCDTERCQPLLVVQVDDGSREDEDAFIDQVLEEIGAPILHVRPQKNYMPSDIADKVRETIERYHSKKRSTSKTDVA